MVAVSPAALGGGNQHTTNAFPPPSAAGGNDRNHYDGRLERHGVN
jgi:hypothetical protein